MFDDNGLSDSQIVRITVDEADSCLLWLKTDNGDVHGRGNVNAGLARAGEYNAAYLITADGSIANFSSSKMAGKQRANYQLPFNILRRPDLSFISSNTINIPGNFGNNGTMRLDGYIYNLDGDIWDFKNVGQVEDIFIIGPNNDYGNGTFYRNGNLTIKDNIYIDETNGVGNVISELPSVAFVVNGDLVIDPTVTHLNGIFYVLGEFATGQSDQPLTIDGAVAAESFNLERDLFNSDDPDELFIYDPRLFINPPPGFLR